MNTVVSLVRIHMDKGQNLHIGNTRYHMHFDSLNLAYGMVRVKDNVQDHTNYLYVTNEMQLLEIHIIVTALHVSGTSRPSSGAYKL